MSSLSAQRTNAYKPLFAWFCFFALAWTTCLLFAGGFTTSIRAGMAFLDWPLSDGSLNPDGWLTEIDKTAEHSHRLLAMIIGLLTLTIAAWAWVREERRWLRWLAIIAAGLVVVQGVLGGLRVKMDQLNHPGWDSNIVARSFAIAHACAAQIFLCVLVSIAVASTRRWIERRGGLQRAPSKWLRISGIAACTIIFVQLVLGAVMRHSHAGLAISTFPLTPEGNILPTTWSFPVAIHFAHRWWALMVTLAIVDFGGRLWASRHIGRVLGAGTVLLTFVVSLQIFLGGLIVWTQRNPDVATVHMLIGAFLLATCWGLTFLAHRFQFADAMQGAPELRARNSSPRAPQNTRILPGPQV